MLDFKWHLFDAGYECIDVRDNSTDGNRFPDCLCPINPDETPREIRPLTLTEKIHKVNKKGKEYEEDLPLFAALAYTVTNDPVRFKRNLLRFTDHWGMWEDDGYSWKERSTDIRKTHYKGFEEYEDYSHNSILVLAVEAVLLNALLNLWKVFKGEQGKKEFAWVVDSSYFDFSIYTEETVLPNQAKEENEKDGEPLEKLKQLLDLLHTEEAVHKKNNNRNKEKPQRRKENKIFFDLRNPCIPPSFVIRCEIDSNNITIHVGADNTIYPLAGLRERFFPALKERNPYDNFDDFRAAIQIIIHHFIQHRLYRHPVRLALDIMPPENSESSLFFMPQNLISAVWYQFAKAILGHGETWQPVFCSECGEPGFYNSGEWVIHKGRFYHNKEGAYCYRNFKGREYDKERKKNSKKKVPQKTL